MWKDWFAKIYDMAKDFAQDKIIGNLRELFKENEYQSPVVDPFPDMSKKPDVEIDEEEDEDEPDNPDWFKLAVEHVLKHEGEYVCDPSDIGMATKYGISLRYLNLTRQDLNLDGTINRQDIEDLTREQAIAIYKKDWWDRYKYYELDSYLIAYKLFDIAVNTGATQATKLLQVAINRMYRPLVDVDGVLGSETKRAVNKLVVEERTEDLYGEYLDQCVHFYVNLSADRPELSKYLSGWLARVND